MIGIITPATRSHHFRFRTYELFSSCFLLSRAHVVFRNKRASVPSHAFLLRGTLSGAVCTVAQLGATTSKLPYSHSSHAQLNMHDGM